MPENIDEAVSLEEYGLTVEDVRTILHAAKELEDSEARNRTMEKEYERIRMSAMVTLLVFVDDRCIGQKKVPLLDAEGPDGVACRLYRHYDDGSGRKVRVIGLINGRKFLYEPNDGTEVSNIAHYESDPDYYR